MTSIELNEQEIQALLNNEDVYIRANITVGMFEGQIYVNLKGDERKPVKMILEV